MFPLAKIINVISRVIFRQQSEPLPETHQVMLFWAGLRGAIAFALATSLTGSSASAIRTTILCVVVLSVLIFGSTTTTIIDRLGIRTGIHSSALVDDEVSDNDGGDENDDEYEIYTENNVSYAQISDGEYEDHSDEQRLRVEESGLRIRRANGYRRHWWARLDEHWFQPLFIRKERALRIRRQRHSQRNWQQPRQHTSNISRRGTSSSTSNHEHFYDEPKYAHDAIVSSSNNPHKPSTPRTTRVFGQLIDIDAGNQEESNAQNPNAKTFKSPK